jgi:hypothetical protein
MIDKLFIAVVALAFGLPMNAASIHDFNPNADYGTSATRRTLDGQCYDSKGNDRVCFRRVKGEIYNVAVIDISESTYPHAMIIDCDRNYHEGYGPLSEDTAANWVTAFCETGRY